ncbi:MAG TPA: LytTR family DNA-binding domain-containing protein [Hanamia sp.]|nr:LytTR family DNA-binding domain-containing protein [Hanamia sp.]
MINCVAVDDEPLALEVIKKHISKSPELHLEAVFSDPKAALDYLTNKPADLLFLDILMPGLNGLQLYKQLTPSPMVIFTTAYKEYAVEAFDLDAIDYLLKPFDQTRFQKGIKKAIFRFKIASDESNALKREFLYIHSDYKMIKIACEDIIFIEASNDYAKIHTSAQSYLTLLSMKAIMEKLSADQFFRIHRSYIVSKVQIAFTQFRKVGMLNGIELPVGDTYRKEILKVKKGK